MITIELPLWLAIVIQVCFVLMLIHFIVGDLFAKLIHKHYQLILREKNKENKNEQEFRSVRKINER